MSEQTAPTAPPAASGARALGLGCLGCAGLVFVAVVALLIRLTWDSPRDLPRAAPEEMADRAVRHSQEAYGVLGFTRTVPPGGGRIGVDARNSLDAGYCYDGGLLGLEDKTIDGAYRMSHDWALDEVPASQAVPGLRRLHRRLEEDGWEVSSYREGGKGGKGGRDTDWSLYVQRDGGTERMSFTWFPDRQYFTGDATAPCAYDSGWTDGSGDTYFPSDAARSVTPPVLRPGRL
ncbi:hypothetical protein [Streptomyces cyanogenus]|uniref:Lipoprotein n=1 Tax=Streptomyces cyanogenus TaxID=80860 RepID=A0ABX7TXJ8_STRCY|nr:hypothetical protein [Streptomyces cyanogenus]QTE00142.1 hypothetical protein S1361_22600 [Streptomyces cyanogenus]